MNKSLPPANPPWGILEALAVLIVINVLALIIRNFGQEWLIFLTGFLPGGITLINKLLISSIIQTFLFLFFIGLIVLGKYKLSIKYLGLVKTRSGRWLKTGLLNGIILFFVVLLIGALLSRLFPVEIKPQPIEEIIVSAQTGWEKVIPFIVVSLLAPVSEELYFRGFLYPALRSRMGVFKGILVTSLIFGGLHFDWFRMIPLSFGGIWLNWLYEKSGSLYCSIIAHGVWNGIMTILIYLAPQFV